MAIYLVKKIKIEAQTRPKIEAQTQAQDGAILFDETPIFIPIKYSDYSNIFLAENVAELPKHTGMNDYIIKVEKDKHPSFDTIHNLGPV